MKSWSALYLSFTRYASCDDGSIAEGYSASVSKLLAHHWPDFEDLRVLTIKSRAFNDFVLRHIDESISPDDRKLIEQNARAHCPAKGEMLCRSILEYVTEAH